MRFVTAWVACQTALLKYVHASAHLNVSRCIEATRGLFAEVLRNGDGEKHMTVVYETLKAKPL